MEHNVERNIDSRSYLYYNKEIQVVLNFWRTNFSSYEHTHENLPTLQQGIC